MSLHHYFCNKVFKVTTMMNCVWLIIVHKFDAINFSICISNSIVLSQVKVFFQVLLGLLQKVPLGLLQKVPLGLLQKVPLGLLQKVLLNLLQKMMLLDPLSGLSVTLLCTLHDPIHIQFSFTITQHMQFNFVITQHMQFCQPSMHECNCTSCKTILGDRN